MCAEVQEHSSSLHARMLAGLLIIIMTGKEYWIISFMGSNTKRDSLKIDEIIRFILF